MLGGVLSIGVTLNVQLFEFPDASVAVIVTTVGPVTTVEAAGDCVRTGEVSQLSLTVAKLV